ncbi:MAG: tetratricopeptide repeat protein [Lentisphaeria bacterium]|nr:tetratricopeptide repeat protein [Lentisphaeria bacterium]
MKNSRQILMITCLSFVVLMTAILVVSYRPAFTQAHTRVCTPSAAQMRNERLLHQLGRAYANMDKGDFATAERDLLQILKERPTHSMAMQLLGHVYYRAERYKDAEKIYREMIQNNEFDASAYNNLGQVLSRQGRHKEALTELEHARSLNPGNMTVYINLSVVYAALNQHEKARDMFMAAHRQLLEKQRKTQSAPGELRYE